MSEGTDPNCDIEAFGDKIKIAIGKHQLNPNAGMRVEECPNKRNNMPPTEKVMAQSREEDPAREHHGAA